MLKKITYWRHELAGNGPPDINNPARHVIDNLDYIIEIQKVPALLAELCSGAGEKPTVDTFSEQERLNTSLRHLGHTNSNRPLTPAQREIIQRTLKLNDGEILSVHGPPEKFSLLQNIIASLWVEAAVRQNAPPIMVVCSQELNQSDDFEHRDHLAGRWLPTPISGFGCRLKNFSKLAAQVENPEYLATAEEYFLERLEQHYRYQPESVAKAAEFLQEQLKQSTFLIQQPINSYLNVLNNLDDLSDITGIERQQLEQAPDKSVAGFLNEMYEKHKTQQEKTDVMYRNHQAYEKEHELLLYAYQEVSANSKQSTVGTLKSFLGFKPKFDLHDFIVKHRLGKYFPGLTPEMINSGQYNLELAARQLWDSIQNLDQEIMAEQKDSLNIKTRIDRARHTLSKYKASLTDWQDEFPNVVNNPNWENSLDTHYRHEAFLLAMHYWEARWIVAVREHLSKIYHKAPDGKSLAETSARFSRAAMLTPGIVSDLTELPGFFSFRTPSYTPLLNYIDLLIVDEPANPPLASASFSLAKKALAIRI